MTEGSQIKDETTKRPLRRGARQIARKRSLDRVSVDEREQMNPF
jgi:hypothetical protein